MLPEIKILIYVIFVFILFFIESLTVYSLIGIVLLIPLLSLSYRQLKAGWIPLSLFLTFTFISNVLFQHGRVLISIGSLVITEEGLNIAAVRTLRIFFMVAGVKILMGRSTTEDIIKALSRIMSPLEKLGLPVRDFFHTMGLTVKCFPLLKNMASEEYMKKTKAENVKGFRGRVRIISSFILPLFVKSIQAPEVFFNEKKSNGK